MGAGGAKAGDYMKEVAVGRKLRSRGHELVLPTDTHPVELDFDAIKREQSVLAQVPYVTAAP
jgi:hypothetical protein